MAAAVLLVMLALLLVPMLALSRYDMPMVDDFRFGYTTHIAWEQTHSISAVLRAGAAYTEEIYETWQGTFSAVFLMTLQPGVFGTQYYGLTTWIMLGILLLGVLAIVSAVGRHVLGCTRAERWILFAVIAISCTQFTEGAVEAFYWFNGAAFYTFFFALMLLLWALIIRFLHRSRGKAWNVLYYIAIPLLSGILGGGNYTTALHIAVLFTALTVYRFFFKKDRNLLLPIGLLVFLAFFAANLTAPGNASRITQEGGAAAAFWAIVKSIAMAVRRGGRYTTVPLAMMMLFLVPIGWRFAERTPFSFRLPVLVSAASLLFMASGFTPTYYTQNFWGAYRLLAIQYDLYTFLLATNVLYWTGWFRRRLLPAQEGLSERLGSVFRARAMQLGCGFIALFLLVCVSNYSMFAAADAAESLIGGDAAAYHAEMEERFEILENAEDGSDAVVPPLLNQPELLLIYEYSADPQSPSNGLLARFFELNSVRVGTDAPSD